MKTALAVLALAAALLPAGAAQAEEKFLGTVASIEMIASPAGAVATLKSTDGTTLQLHVDDAVTLEKFKDGRITPGDLIKARYEVKGGKNRAVYFKKSGGC